MLETLEETKKYIEENGIDINSKDFINSHLRDLGIMFPEQKKEVILAQESQKEVILPQKIFHDEMVLMEEYPKKKSPLPPEIEEDKEEEDEMTSLENTKKLKKYLKKLAEKLYEENQLFTKKKIKYKVVKRSFKDIEELYSEIIQNFKKFIKIFLAHNSASQYNMFAFDSGFKNKRIQRSKKSKLKNIFIMAYGINNTYTKLTSNYNLGDIKKLCGDDISLIKMIYHFKECIILYLEANNNEYIEESILLHYEDIFIDNYFVSNKKIVGKPYIKLLFSFVKKKPNEVNPYYIEYETKKNYPVFTLYKLLGREKGLFMLNNKIDNIIEILIEKNIIIINQKFRKTLTKCYSLVEKDANIYNFISKCKLYNLDESLIPYYFNRQTRDKISDKLYKKTIETKPVEEVTVDFTSFVKNYKELTTEKKQFYLPMYNWLDKLLTKKEGKQIFLILCGPPDIGKSSFIRYIETKGLPGFPLVGSGGNKIYFNDYSIYRYYFGILDEADRNKILVNISDLASMSTKGNGLTQKFKKTIKLQGSLNTIIASNYCINCLLGNDNLKEAIIKRSHIMHFGEHLCIQGRWINNKHNTVTDLLYDEHIDFENEGPKINAIGWKNPPKKSELLDENILTFKRQKTHLIDIKNDICLLYEEADNNKKIIRLYNAGYMKISNIKILVEHILVEENSKKLENMTNFLKVELRFAKDNIDQYIFTIPSITLHFSTDMTTIEIEYPYRFTEFIRSISDINPNRFKEFDLSNFYILGYLANSISYVVYHDIECLIHNKGMLLDSQYKYFPFIVMRDQYYCFLCLKNHFTPNSGSLLVKFLNSKKAIIQEIFS